LCPALLQIISTEYTSLLPSRFLFNLLTPLSAKKSPNPACASFTASTLLKHNSCVTDVCRKGQRMYCSQGDSGNIRTVKPRFTNNSVYEQIFRTQSVSDDVLCLELRTCKPSKRRQKQITLDNFLVRQRNSGSEAESSGAKRQKKEKESPSKQ